MTNNLEEAKESLLYQMKTDADWRNYYQDILSYLANEHNLSEAELCKLATFMHTTISK